MVIIFHQFFLPDLYYYPTSYDNLTKSHAHIISQRSSPSPPWGGHGVGQNQKKMRRREREIRYSLRTSSRAGKSFAEARSFNGNGRSVFQDGWPP